MLNLRSRIAALAVGSLAFGKGWPVDLGDTVSIDVVAAAAFQHQALDNASDESRVDGLLMPTLSFRPSAADELSAKFAFATGNALDNVSPFVLSPWDADLKDGVEDINGRNRDYLLTAWYKYSFQFEGDRSLDVTAGLIDGTDYLDINRYSNDENTQFLNQVFVNARSSVVPSYDIGAATEWHVGSWALTAVGMQVGENDDGNEYYFAGTQARYRLETALGEGNYRILLEMTSSDFENTTGDRTERRQGLVFSADQQLATNLGAFMRLGWQEDDAAVTYEALYSGGLVLDGAGWSRSPDELGIAAAYIDGGNEDVDASWAFEAYYLLQIDQHFALTLDLQYMKDELRNSRDPKGFIVGVRLVADF